MKNEGMAEHLFSNRGPLSDFQGKILVAHAFRIIDDNFAEELHSLRAIRNTFAHSKIPVSFDTELIKRELQTIVSANLLRQKALETPIIKTWKNKHHFLFAIKVFLTFIGEAMERGGDFEEVRQAFRDEAKRLASK
jgi:DNA-binding MltR family transcriptional regulator